jgi:hypothetical protein
MQCCALLQNAQPFERGDQPMVTTQALLYVLAKHGHDIEQACDLDGIVNDWCDCPDSPSVHTILKTIVDRNLDDRWDDERPSLIDEPAGDGVDRRVVADALKAGDFHPCAWPFS